MRLPLSLRLRLGLALHSQSVPRVATVVVTNSTCRRFATRADAEMLKPQGMEMPVQPSNPHMLKVALIGRPNVGKSTLVNNILAHKVSIVSPRPQTTRGRVLGILTEDNVQTLFFDTPGILESASSRKLRLSRPLLVEARHSALEADLVSVMAQAGDILALDLDVLQTPPSVATAASSNASVRTGDSSSDNSSGNDIQSSSSSDASSTDSSARDEQLQLLPARTGRAGQSDDEHLLAPLSVDPVSRAELTTKRHVLILNKVDLAKRAKDFRPKLQALEKIVKQKKPLYGITPYPIVVDRLFVVSALKGEGVEPFKAYLRSLARPGEWLYPQGQVTDQSIGTVVQEAIREQLFLKLRQELPYTVQQRFASAHRDEQGVLHVEQEIFTKSAVQKMIVIGAKGQTIQSITSAAEREIESVLGQPVRLTIRVQVATKNQMAFFGM
eukprot:m.94302 g.94302  ORF g.94302 m.94302 type:complete len:441 (+) comp15403_c0_seq2:363-1685(+)